MTHLSTKKLSPKVSFDLGVSSLDSATRVVGVEVVGGGWHVVVLKRPIVQVHSPQRKSPVQTRKKEKLEGKPNQQMRNQESIDDDLDEESSSIIKCSPSKEASPINNQMPNSSV